MPAAADAVAVDFDPWARAAAERSACKDAERGAGKDVGLACAAGTQDAKQALAASQPATDAWSRWRLGGPPGPPPDYLTPEPRRWERGGGDGAGGGGGRRWGDRAGGDGANWRGCRQEVINWDGIDIVPVQKNFFFEHPSVAGRTEEECERIRVANGIHVVKNRSQESLPKPICRFEEAPFPYWAADILKHKDYQRPTPIQVQSWPIVLRGFDFVGISETGSGKTVAYILPMLVHLMAQPELRPGEGPIGIVLVPTRELCRQVAAHVCEFIGDTSITCRALYGGEEIDQDARQVAQRTDVVVATPGRLITLLNGKATNLRRATFVVLDEADDLLSQGFGEQVHLILSHIRPDRQMLLFSATWGRRVDDLAAEVCWQKPIHINVGSMRLSACKSIQQRFIKVGPDMDKEDILCKSLVQIRESLCDGQKALIFCNRRAQVEPLAASLMEKGYPCTAFHGAQDQEVRDSALGAFDSPDSGLWLLVCTNILGRGCDFANVRFVVNYDMPPKVDEYVHRIGRTGRAGQDGFSLTFIAEGDMGVARDLAMVLRESQQDVPKWLQSGARRPSGRYGFAAGRGPPPPPAEGPRPPHAVDAASLQALWGGRGKGRRHEYIGRCRGRGAARMAPPGRHIDAFEDPARDL